MGVLAPDLFGSRQEKLAGCLEPINLNLFYHIIIGIPLLAKKLVAFQERFYYMMLTDYIHAYEFRQISSYVKFTS
jgi:hypothetical protein